MSRKVDRRIPELLSEYRWCRNVQAPDGRFWKRAADAVNHIAAYRKKTVIEYFNDMSNIPVGASGTNDTYYFGCHTGYGTTTLACNAVMATCDDTNATDPYIELRCQAGFSGGVALSGSEYHYGAIDASPSDVPDEMCWNAYSERSVAENTDYRVWIRLGDYARIHSFVVYEWCGSPVDETSDGACDPLVTTGAHILDDEIADIAKASSNLTRENCAHILNFTGWEAGGSSRLPDFWSIAYTNILDETSTTVTAASPGYEVELSYHRSLAGSTTKVKLAVYAERTAGVGTNSKVRVTDGTNHVEVTGITGGAAWYTTTGTLPASELKLDIQLLSSSATTIKIYAVSLWEVD
jgi:hypothetical protein